MNLASRWLDLDRIAGAGESAAPLDSIVPLALRLRDLLPAEGRSRASFTIDQANVGREAVSGLRLALARSSDKLEVEELRLGMPGGSRGELQGVVSGPADAPVFDGSLGLRGTSVVRFLGWATRHAAAVRRQGRRRLRRARAAVDRARPRRGARHRRRPVGHRDLRRRAIPLGGPAGDVAAPRGPAARRAPLRAGRRQPAATSSTLLHGRRRSAADGPARQAGWRSAQTDALIRVNAGQLITAARTYRDVAMELELKGGHLRLPLLRVAGDEGFSLELEGEVDDAPSRPKGSVARRGRRRHAAGHRAAGRAARHPRTPSAPASGARRAWRRCASPDRWRSARARRPPPIWSLDGEANGAGVKAQRAASMAAPAGWRKGLPT